MTGAARHGVLHTPFPLASLPEDERLYVGVDIGKDRQYAGFVSSTLLRINRTWGRCPWLSFARTAAGFAQLAEAIEQYAPLARVTVLFEDTGPYSKALEQWLLDQRVTCYRQQVLARPNRMEKSDKRDALALASHVYNLVEKSMQPTDRGQEIRAVMAETPLVAHLRPLVQHRHGLGRESARLCNQLTALADELFPELATVLRDVNTPSALALRLAYPTPTAVASATIEQLCATRPYTRPSRVALMQLQELSATTVGCHTPERVAGLAYKQAHLIARLRQVESQIEETDQQIEALVSESREGKIICSLPCFSPLAAATVLALVGNISRFETVGKLRAYCGWAPRREQTGRTLDSTVLARGGHKLLRQTIILATWQAIRQDTPWRTVYTRLVERKCAQDSNGEYIGKMRVVADIAGRIVRMLYALLTQDAQALARLEPGQELPEPTLYDRARHERDLTGKGLAARASKQ